MLLVGFSIAYSSVVFQTVTNNRILTPSIIGFDSLYMLIQTVIVFVFGSTTLTMMSKNVHFLVNVGLMVLFAGLLYRWLFQREGRNLYFLILVGVIFGTLFGSVTSFLQRLIDPNDFVVLQDRMFSSFNNVNEDLLFISIVGVLLVTAYSMRFTKNLDVISLGRDQAINLGVDHSVVVNRFMVIIAILVSVATALVGPITFFGLLVERKPPAASGEASAATVGTTEGSTGASAEEIVIAHPQGEPRSRRTLEQLLCSITVHWIRWIN